MGPVEAKILEFMKRRRAEGAFSVTEDEIMNAVVPAEHPEFRFRPAYRYGIDRLQRRNLISRFIDPDGKTHWILERYPSAELRRSIGR